MKYFILLLFLFVSIASFPQDKPNNSKDSVRRANSEKNKSEQGDEIPKYDDAEKETAPEPESKEPEPVEVIKTEEELLKEIDRETMEAIERDLEESMQRQIKDSTEEPIKNTREEVAIEKADDEVPETQTQPEEKPVEVKTYHHYYHNSRDKNEQRTMARSMGHSGGYGALLFKVTDFNETSVLMTGIRAMWVINRSFGIGFEGNGIIPVSKFESIDPEGINQAILLGGYGGLALEPVFWSNSVVHFTFPISFGGGWLGYIEDWGDNYYYYNPNLYDQDVFWYVEPGANIEFNVASFFRIDFGMSKRYTYDLNLYNSPVKAFEGWNYTFAMKFGRF